MSGRTIHSGQNRQ